ncbi:MAG: hypothetical protein K6T65_14320 [Peptococcaceae bacterium]|nr:hypothetical protein [Peptococcaceae bacterium]
MPKEYRIPIDPASEELRQIKARQKERKVNPAKNPGLQEIYEMLSDVLENQARHENMLRELRAKLH